ncbi:MAG: hypothetical protein DRP01_00815 [Archaeoglobales archaeon]|nr:MAG: hypothetical protein DRP01_00815 [Archaeoglobales archaeon]
MEYKYVEDERSTSKSNNIKKFLVILLSFLVVMSVFSTGFYLQLFPSMCYVNPELYEALKKGKKIVVYAASLFSLKGYERMWKFGMLKIYKFRVSTLGEINNLKRFCISIFYYGDVEPTIPYSHIKIKRSREVDIKHIYHGRSIWSGAGVTVAVVDTGVDYTHPAFNIEQFKVLVSFIYVTKTMNYVWWDFDVNGSIDDLKALDSKNKEENGESVFYDDNGHGTHVIGCIVSRGKYRGLAPDCDIISIKAFFKTGISSIDIVLSALEWIYNNADKYSIDIVNLSWGVYMKSTGKDPVSLACQSIVEDKKCYVVAAAGNEGNVPGTILIPAVNEKVIAVGAIDPFTDKIAHFSSLGPTRDLRMKPDFICAGVDIVSTISSDCLLRDQYPELVVDEYYMSLSGTSMATPIMSSIIASYIEKFGKREALNEIIERVRRINPLFKDFISGHGIPIMP